MEKTMSHLPLVSVIVPCYNHAEFLTDSLTGLLNQDYENLEVLICDDCSTDNSPEIIRAYEAEMRDKFKNLVLFFNTANCGLTKNLNRMLKCAQGTYIKLIASDDVMKSNAISSLVTCFEENPEAFVIVCNGVKISEDQHYPNFRPIASVYEGAPDFSQTGFLERTMQKCDIFAPGAMLRKSLYEDYGFYDEAIFMEDFEYWLRLIKNNVPFCYCPDKLIYYRVNTESMSSTANSINLEMRRRRFHGAVMKTLRKYEDEVPKDIYTELCIKKIINEQSFAADKKLRNWESDLRKEVYQFLKRGDIPAWKKIYFRYRILRIQLRKYFKP